MDKQLIISVGREYGSGGHEIAQKLADFYGLPLYDHNLLQEVAAKLNLSDEELADLKDYDEKEKNYLLARTIKGYNNSPEQNVAKLQFNLLREWAKEGKSCVIVGRCSDQILKDNPNVITIFVNGTDLAKIERLMRIYDLGEQDAEEKMKKVDKKRREYHNSNCKADWGKASSYDLCICSSHLGIDGTVEILKKYIEARTK